jgi:hypothetical protein
MIRRINIIENIQNMLPETEDDILTNTYVDMCNLLDDEYEDINRRQKLQYITKNIMELDHNELINIQEKIDNRDDEEKRLEKMYIVVLDVLNDIIDTFNDGTQHITKLEDFKNITLSLLGTTKAAEAFKNKEDLIFSSGYKKTECKYSDSKRLRRGHLTMLRIMIKKIGYTLSSKSKQKIVDGVRLYPTYYFITRD